MFETIGNYFVSPTYLFLIPLVILIMFIFINTNKRLFFTRGIMLIFLVIALAGPYSPFNIFGGGVSKIAVLEDNSSSYDLFGENVGETAYNKLRGNGRVSFDYFGDKLVSNIGDALIGSLEDGKNVVLVSDGNVNEGEGLEKVREVAIIENLSVSLIKKEPKESDYSISIIGPSKVGPNTEATFNVVVMGTDDSDRNLELLVDGKSVMGGKTRNLEYNTKFSEGYHELVAKILDKDFFEENNIYYHSLKVVEKPDILLFGDEGTPLHKTLSMLYNVGVGGLYNLDKYHAVVIDDKDISEIGDKVGILKKYVEDGNGLIVVGGKNSFDGGGYSNSKFEDILPVKVEGVGKKSGNVNVIIVVDISSSTGADFGVSTGADVAKSLATSVIDNIADEHNLGIVAFSSDGVVVEELGLLEDKDRSQLKSAIASLVAEGYTNLGSGVSTALDMLKGTGGGKNIILISDGASQGDWMPTVANARDSGVKIYTVGVGNNPNSVLGSIADTTGGQFYQASQAHQLAIEFGDPEGVSGDSAKLNIKDSKHFITEKMITTAKIYGTNQVLPKNSAQLLITSGKGDPVLSVWRLGLGRVAVFSADDGRFWAGEVYTGTDSKLISRIINWGAGDPERKKTYFFSVDNARVGEDIKLIVKGNKPPSNELRFEKKSDGTYLALTHVNSPGFYEFGDDKYSVNYNDEFEYIGINNELEDLVHASGGRTFNGVEDLSGISDYIKEKANVLSVEKELFVWPFIALAMIIFILDVWLRTVQERKNI